MTLTARSTVLAISGIAPATAPATRASSELMILRMRSVGNRSISTERGLRPSVVMVEKRHGSYILFPVIKEVDVRIRRAEGLVDYQACIELQKEVWGFTQTEDLAALPMLMVGNRFGGNVLVAQDPSGRFIGFSFALPAWRRNGTRLWWSHMTAVLQEYRSK